MEILVNINNIGTRPWDCHFSCPLRSDLDICCALPKSEINHCPKMMETDDDYYAIAPDDCPLRKSDVTIKKQ